MRLTTYPTAAEFLAAAGPTLFWLTFDGRGLTMADDGESGSGAREEKG